MLMEFLCKLEIVEQASILQKNRGFIVWATALGHNL